MSIWSWIKTKVLAFWGNYEGANRNRDRSILRGRVQDARFDADDFTRSELLRNVRHFERNDAIANRLGDVFEQYTVGATGLRFTPASSNTEWNKVAARKWSEWCSKTGFQGLQSLAAYRWFFDGEVFLILTHEPGTNPKVPSVQLVETHRVETPGRLLSEPESRVQSGVEIDRRGRPMAYYVRQDFAGQDEARRIPAQYVVHVFEPSRAGQLRGLPLLTPVLADLHDLSDLQVLEKRVAKKGASMAAVFRTRTGEVPAINLRRERLLSAGKTSTNADTTETRLRQIEEVSGGDTIALYNDEAFEQPKNDRPGLVQQQFWDYLTNRVCVGTGIPKMLVFPYSVQGTVARADLDVAAAFFRARSAVLQAAFTRVYEYWLTEAIRYDAELASGAPADFLRVTVRPPRSPNVDVGRNSTAMLSELEGGVRTFEGIYGEAGDDYREQLRQRAVEAAYILALSKEFDVPPEMIAKNIGETARVEPQEPQKQEFSQ